MTDGIDLTEVDGVSFGLLLALITEVGLDLSMFPSAKHFVSWLGLCPNKKVSGGKILSSKTRKNKGRLAYAFRQSANSVGNQKDTALSYAFRALAYKHGRKVAITATARKIATIVYNMLEKGQPYQPMGTLQYQNMVRQKKVMNIQRTIKKHDVKVDELAFS